MQCQEKHTVSEEHQCQGKHLSRASWAGSQLGLPHDGGGVQRHRLCLRLLSMDQLVAVDAVDLSRNECVKDESPAINSIKR